MGWTSVVSLMVFLIPVVSFGFFNSEGTLIQPRAFVCLEDPVGTNQVRLLLRVTETIARATSQAEQNRQLPVIIDLFAISLNGEVSSVKSGLGRSMAGPNWIQITGRDIAITGRLFVNAEQKTSTPSIDGQNITFKCSLAKGQ